MTRRKPSENEIKRRLIDDAASADAWERVATVGPTSSPRPAWYGNSAKSAPDAAIAAEEFGVDQVSAEVRQELLGEREGSSRSDSASKNARFEAVFRKYFRRIVALCQTLLNASEEDAVDLGQEVFAAFYTVMDRFDGDITNLEAITKSMALNRARALKSASRGAEIVRIEDARAKRERLRNFGQRREDAYITALRRMDLDYAIASLPEGQREAIRLWLDGLPYADIAAALHVSTDAVRSRLRDAKRHLRSDLDDRVARAGRHQSNDAARR
jgi:RNA polymerase sigma factor (sigma-70 family)